jgi:hypothetical protein
MAKPWLSPLEIKDLTPSLHYRVRTGGATGSAH